MDAEDKDFHTSSPEFLDRMKKSWLQTRQFTPARMDAARLALEDVRQGKSVFDAIKRHPLNVEGGGYIGKSFLVAAYRQLVAEGVIEADSSLLEKIRMKPMRTLSGVTTVTVLTKPFPCPGKCIFCPTDARMPKSYLADEPGATRALHHNFDPYEQVVARIDALEAIGHPTDKIELLILGGTWSAYQRAYQEWFVLRCLEAMNNAPPGTPSDGPGDNPDERREKLLNAQRENEMAQHRNVGLVIETRPDHVDEDEVSWLRHLGVTKVQMGAQSFDDKILEMNKRGHTVAETLRASALLRAAGYKFVLHWMPNLLGATPDSDRSEFQKMWRGFCPDEIKIYPTQLLANAELYDHWLAGAYHPYSTETLLNLLVDVKTTIPRYCRVNRVIRDIPSTNVVEGNKRTSLRQDVQRELNLRGERCKCIRCSEIRGRAVDLSNLQMDDLVYDAESAEEHFLSYRTPKDRLAGFLRLSLPNADAPKTGMTDLGSAAIIREVHVYGQSLRVGEDQKGAAQHLGLGTQLLQEAEEISRKRGYARLAVISAVGTRRYYLDRGFERGELYLVKSLKANSDISDFE